MKTSIIAFLLLHTVLLHPLIVARQLLEFDGKGGVRHEITNVEGNDGSNGGMGRGGVLQPPPSPVPNCRPNQLHC
ncbi:hypothetical protein D5086_008569 [Populus alba]|uniref:Uncharacterized protein n=1 Tax=Populus alba TaxID=43335 RepID=A0ACC4CH40_POPAL